MKFSLLGAVAVGVAQGAFDVEKLGTYNLTGAKGLDFDLGKFDFGKFGLDLFASDKLDKSKKEKKEKPMVGDVIFSEKFDDASNFTVTQFLDASDNGQNCGGDDGMSLYVGNPPTGSTPVAFTGIYIVNGTTANDTLIDTLVPETSQAITQNNINQIPSDTDGFDGNFMIADGVARGQDGATNDVCGSVLLSWTGAVPTENFSFFEVCLDLASNGREKYNTDDFVAVQVQQEGGSDWVDVIKVVGEGSDTDAIVSIGYPQNGSGSVLTPDVTTFCNVFPVTTDTFSVRMNIYNTFNDEEFAWDNLVVSIADPADFELALQSGFTSSPTVGIIL
uniref:Uncharacterized protein n=1 Tax=Chromera velia CCMP2878 TaxID=1169474 RepID=A0A0G4IG69_9ALVE|mmetsp:Transcript_8547/g.16763  ORF Transcript_8547/g.16763 Transcript_8547/m.16763 type:complete len:333 (-) Transcript_8547:765-1763(-)|eukprot:Cvel_14161.t1-p1 / transcript=Cvel_14161.t1 / gene=Cvel_14161 / organism=Chromera_velia_CCMP2878 / gene_product=hypothetical protein / transcript_product=hypothetical protein / location=Cvel_scaffold998:1266-2561(-) / protein_length=332 / sequence_SO=supercontig / SO=protein_coding / is_pseudo=false